MTYNVRNIAIALVLAAVAAFLVIAYTGDVKKQAKSQQETIGVLKAATDIPAGTSAEEAISSGKLKVEQVVQQDEIPLALHKESELDGTSCRASPSTRASRSRPRCSRRPARPASSAGSTRPIARWRSRSARRRSSRGRFARVITSTWSVPTPIHSNNGGSDFDVVRHHRPRRRGDPGARGNRGHRPKLGRSPKGSRLRHPQGARQRRSQDPFTLQGGDFACGSRCAPRPRAAGTKATRATAATAPPRSRPSSVVFDGLTGEQIVKAIKVPAPKGN